MPNTEQDPEHSRAPVRALALESSVEDLVVRADVRSEILYVSDSCRSLGYEPEELVGRLACEFVHPDDLARFAANTRRLFTTQVGEGPVDREFRYRRKDGTWAWLVGHPTILPTRDGRLGDILNVFCEVTQRREMIEALREQARKARS
jgi:PAS domain S-box-containing protein